MRAIASLVLLLLATVTPQANAAPPVVTLTQTPCQIVEAEGKKHRFTSHSKDECVVINEATLPDRILRPLILKPGKTVFRVTNKSVPYELGFWVRGKGTGRITLPSVSGGGLFMGETKEYVINLKPGEYYYSCPLNVTPDYPLTVAP